MKKTNYTCILILSLLLSLCPLRLSAVTYGNSYTPAYSDYEEAVNINSSLAEGTPSGDYPAYVPAMSGDLNPFGTSEPVNAPRRAPGKTGGDKDGPAFPLSDANWFLLLLLALYAACTGYMRYRRESKKRPS